MEVNSYILCTGPLSVAGKSKTRVVCNCIIVFSIIFSILLLKKETLHTLSERSSGVTSVGGFVNLPTVKNSTQALFMFLLIKSEKKVSLALQIS